MDWFTVLLILIFFVFPLIQQIVEARKPEAGPEAGPGEPAEEDPEPVHVRRTPAGRGAATRPADASDTWSADWGHWPGQRHDEAVNEPVPRSIEVEPRSTVESISKRPAASIPVYDDDRRPVYDDEHRQERKIAGPRSRPPVTEAPEWQLDLSDLAAIRDRRKLRSVIVMSEILGAPRGLRD